MVTHTKVSNLFGCTKTNYANIWKQQDMAEHALYVAVKDHDIRPPMSKLTNIYPRNLLVLVMEMWETDPTLVSAISIEF